MSKAYPEYKDSGIEWLGEVPTHWETVKLKHAAAIVTGNTPSTSYNENYRDGVHPWIKLDELDGLNPVIDSKGKLSDKGKTRPE